MAVDTRSLARELKAAELSSVQAEAIAAAIGRAVLEGAATKGDIQLLGSELREMETRLEAKIEQLKSTLMAWFIGTVLTLAAISIAAAKL